MSQVKDPADFDFLIPTWNVLNRRRKIWSITEEPERSADVEWEEFHAVAGKGEKLLDGQVFVDFYEGEFPGGLTVLGTTIRAYDPESNLWSFVWLDNRQEPDFTPLVGRFVNGIGTFKQSISTKDGRPLKVQFIWDNLSDHTANWRQELSLDGGATWDLNWTMEFTR